MKQKLKRKLSRGLFRNFSKRPKSNQRLADKSSRQSEQSRLEQVSNFIEKKFKRTKLARLLQKRARQRVIRRRESATKQINNARKKAILKSDGVGHWDHYGKTQADRAARLATFQAKHSEKAQDNGRER